MNTTDQSNQIRPNIFGYDQYPPTMDWTRFQTGSGFMNTIYNGYPSQQNCTSSTTGFPFYSGFANPFNNVNPFTSTANTVNAPTFSLTTSLQQKDSGLNDIKAMTTQIPFRCKRKTDSPPPIMSKQRITEERMALHMSQLHISSETVQVPSTSKINQEPTETRQKRLYMCEEMRRLQTDSILPQSILNKMQRPCTALVLWTPPQRPFPLPNTEPVDEDDDNNNNNNTEIVSNNNNTTINNNNCDDIEVEIIDEEESTMDLDAR